MNRRIIITGGAGFVGSHLARACLRAGDEVHVLVRPGGDEHRLYGVNGPLHRHGIDLLSSNSLRRLLAEIEPHVVFHLAASPRRQPDQSLNDAHAYFGEDLEILINLLDAAKFCRTPPRAMIRTGSLGEYGAAPAPYDEDQREHPLTVYGASLVAATHCIASLAGRLPFSVTTARLALCYGPLQKRDYFIPWLIERCLDGEPSTVRRPDDRRDLLHVDDAVDALMRLADAAYASGSIINISSGLAPAMNEVARLVVAMTDADPDLIIYGRGAPPSGAADLRGSFERAAKLLSWRPRVPLTEGIARTVDWHRCRRRASAKKMPTSARPVDMQQESASP